SRVGGCGTMTLSRGRVPVHRRRSTQMSDEAVIDRSTEERQVDERVDELLNANPPADTAPRDFFGAQFDLGLAWVHFAEGCGGLGLAPGLQTRINERLRAAHAPVAAFGNPIGYGMGAPTVYTHGSDAQRARYLRPLFTNEEIWCQMFSEPGAGS